MKIAFDHEIFCLQKRGGISRYFCCLAEEFRQLGHDVAAFSPYHVNETLDTCGSLVVKGRKVEAYLPKLGGLSVKYNEWKGARDIRAWRPAVVHKTFYSPQQANDFGAPVVVTVHDMIHELFPDEFRTKDKVQQLKRDAVLLADKVICISENTKKDLLKFVDVDEDKVVVIHHGIGLTLPVSNQGTVQDNSSLDKERRPTILYVGARNKYKNFNVLIRALGSSRALREETEIVAFGGGPFTDAELALFKQCGVKHQRQESGSDAQLIQRYRSADVFVCPSMYEGFGFPPLEAMALGCPVVASHASVLPEILGNACVYFNPHDEEELAVAIQRVLFDEQNKARLISAGLEQSARYSWAHTARRTLEVYEALI